MNRATTALLGAALGWAACVPAPVTKTEPTIPVTTTTTDAPACVDPAYGDGVCQADLDCDAPDIDCFRLFDSQGDAEAFFAAFEEGQAALQVREPHPVVPSGDPRWVALRAMLDEGWDAYRAVHEVGDLAGEAPALVLVDDPNPNAFVIADYDADLSAFLVMVTTGLVALGADDDAMLALMLHELEHAVRLHLIADVSDRLRTYYKADGDEPIGADQPDDADVRPFGDAWRALASDAGPFDDPALGGLPFAGGSLYQVFTMVLAERLAADPGGCTAAASPWGAVVGEVLGYADPVAVTLDVPPGTGLPARIDDAMAELRGCWTDLPNDFATVFGGPFGMTGDQVLAELPPEQAAIVDGVHFVDGLVALLDAQRTEMRALEEAFPGDNGGVTWSGLRYFSFEEAADDVTVPVMSALGRRVDAQADMLMVLLPQDQQAACLDLLDAGVPPYGDDLTDEHHATCWRVDHVRRLTAQGGPVARVREPSAARREVRMPATLPPSLRLPERRVADAPPTCLALPGLPELCSPF